MKPTLILTLTLIHASAFAEWPRFESGQRVADLAAFAYDPLSGISQANSAPRRVAGFITVPTGLKPGQSFTVEGFARPDGNPAARFGAGVQIGRRTGVLLRRHLAQRGRAQLQLVARPCIVAD